MDFSEPKEYRMAPELRRCSWYLVFTLLPQFVFGSISAVISRPDVRSRPIALIGLAYGIGIVIAVAFAFRWKLRIDQTGISRRRFFKWSHWSWEEISSGNVSKKGLNRLVIKARHFGDRDLNYTYPSPDDLLEITDIINSRYQLPPPPTISSTLTIRNGSTVSATFDEAGIQYTSFKGTTNYTWDDVLIVEITREVDFIRRDFRMVEIELPDRRIRIRNLGSELSWRGATAEELNEYLFHFAPREKIEERISLRSRPPKTREEINDQILKQKESRRAITWIYSCGVAILILLAFFWPQEDNNAGFWQTTVSTIALLIGIQFVIRSEVKELTARLESLPPENSGAERDPSP